MQDLSISRSHYLERGVGRRKESKVDQVAMNPPERLVEAPSGSTVHWSSLLSEACQKSLAFARL